MITIYGAANSQSRELLSQLINDYTWPTNYNVFVDWAGNTWDSDATSPSTIYLNRGYRLSNYEQLEVLDRNLINIPNFTNIRQKAYSWVEQGKQIWGRQFAHTQGKDIVDMRIGKRFVDSNYWVEVVPNIIQEWRIHVFLGKRIARGLKIKVNDPNPKLHKYRIDLPIRNRQFGWHMRHDLNPPTNISNIAKKAVKVLGYDFGAVDLYVTEDGTVGVFEVNKCPGLDQSTAKAYMNAFYKVAQKKWKRKNG